MLPTRGSYLKYDLLRIDLSVTLMKSNSEQDRVKVKMSKKAEKISISVFFGAIIL